MTRLSGMTGFARVSGEAAWGNWAWEAKSVNGRGLDVRVSTPSGFDTFDRIAKTTSAKLFKRGSLQVSLKIDASSAAAEIGVNQAALSALIAAFTETHGAPPSPEALATLMTVKGVTDSAGQSLRDFASDADVIEDLTAGLEDVLAGLQTSRMEEGASLAFIMSAVLTEMTDTLSAAETHARAQPAALKARLDKQLRELLSGSEIDPDRLAADTALSAAKADVREELDRLAAHIDTARAHLETGAPIGRKLDFLSQELNREANTLCSKSACLELTNAGLALKGLVDQFKEQAANVE